MTKTTRLLLSNPEIYFRKNLAVNVNVNVPDRYLNLFPLIIIFETMNKTNIFVK